MPILIAGQITKRYGGVVALEGVSIELHAGEVLGLLGANGSGKSTLSSILAGDNRPDAGSLRVGGVDLEPGSPAAARAAGIAIAHQHPGLAPDLPVWENVYLGAEICGTGKFLNRALARKKVGELLESLRPDWDLDAPAGRLTAADQQLVEIAKSLALEPRVLILDEPTAALAAAEVESLMRKIGALASRGTSIVFISHRMAEVEAVCDRVVVLCNGRPAGEMAVRERIDEAQVIAWMGGTAGGATAAHVHEHAHEHAVPASSLKRLQGASGVIGDAVAEPALSACGLQAGARLRGVDVDVRPGEILGIAGLQGHGQEELLDALAGYRKLDEGQIKLHGVSLTPRSPRQMIDAGVCLVPNDRHRQGLWLEQSVEFNLAQVGVNFEKHPWRLQRTSIKRFVDDVVTRLRIKTSDVSQPVRTLSGGNQQKVVIGRWLDARVNVKVLLLSDPTKGVDVIARKEIYEAVGMLADAGTAVIVYASDTAELLAVCDRLIVLYEGRVVAQLEGKDMNESQVTSALFGRSAA
ncbi:sugar ABC transporter ATP-binding protein [Caballeronia sp. 15711]